MSAGLDYYAGMTRPAQSLPTYRTTPERCGDLGHPGCTYNVRMDRTWCLCGQVITDGDTAVPHIACCGGPLTEALA